MSSGTEELDIAYNSIFKEALYLAHLNESYVARQNDESSQPLQSTFSPPLHPNLYSAIDDRLLYLERALASLQNETYGYKYQIADLEKKNYQLEKEMNIFQQYNRRESVELSGVPADIPQHELENFIIETLRRIGVNNLSSYDVAACHRLRQKFKNEKVPRVIIRFTNRKRAYESIINRRHLRELNDLAGIFIHNSLCFKFREVHEKCAEMKINGEIKKFWVFNGFINIKRTDHRNEKPQKILHIKDLNALPVIWPE